MNPDLGDPKRPDPTGSGSGSATLLSGIDPPVLFFIFSFVITLNHTKNESIEYKDMKELANCRTGLLGLKSIHISTMPTQYEPQLQTGR